ncbi:MAG TPA: LysR family transcriptional regulator [Gemmatimonadaceae bacterium]|nr:LysR family transcriptional regulator [Gemmatimonadaceae bacterium]
MATFVAVAEAKGFRAAGERLGVTHSAVSLALRRLEERIGIALVDHLRESRGQSSRRTSARRGNTATAEAPRRGRARGRR